MNKEELRKLYKEKRKELTKLELEMASIKIHNLLFSRIMIHRFSPIHIFLPIIKNNEINTWPIIETLRKDFSPDIYISKSMVTDDLLHILLKKNTELVENKWGIEEPKDLKNVISSKQFFEKFKDQDILVIIPLLISDKIGHRVGYGKGYYDKFLSFSNESNCTKIGLSLFEPIDLIGGIDKHDIKLNFCITPERIWSF